MDIRNMAASSKLAVPTSDKQMDILIQPYKSLAKFGYRPAQRMVPISNGYSPIDVKAVEQMLMNIGDEPIYLSNSYVTLVEGNTARLHDRIINIGKWRELAPQDVRMVGPALRSSNNQNYIVGIRREKLSDYRGIIPPENAQEIADACEKNIFDSMEIWSPLEINVVEKVRDMAEAERMLLEKRTKVLLEDPIAVGVTGTDSEERLYIVSMWGEDLIIEGDMQWFLAG